MAELGEALAEAENAGILTGPQRARLVEFLAERGYGAGDGEAVPSREMPADSAGDVPLADKEAPRFIRGFHDVLITIGVGAALGGLWGLGSVYAVLPAIVLLAEILVRRQRLALPAFTLTVLFAASASYAMVPLVTAYVPESNPALSGMVLFAAQPVLLAPFYWRYRVPAALALMIASALVTAFMLVLVGIQTLTGMGNILEDGVLLARILALGFALVLFAIAMYFDIGDRQRITRRSDVAFWLHLIAAPALLYTIFSVVLFDPQDAFWWEEDAGLGEALVAMVVVAGMMLTGIVIDRRAFVTSGLISLGVALFILARESAIDMTGLGALPVFMVGLVVLTLGVGWLRLRALVVARMPSGIVRYVPPIAARSA